MPIIPKYYIGISTQRNAASTINYSETIAYFSHKINEKDMNDFPFSYWLISKLIRFWMRVCWYYIGGHIQTTDQQPGKFDKFCSIRNEVMICVFKVVQIKNNLFFCHTFDPTISGLLSRRGYFEKSFHRIKTKVSPIRCEKYLHTYITIFTCYWIIYYKYINVIKNQCLHKLIFSFNFLNFFGLSLRPQNSNQNALQYCLPLIGVFTTNYWVFLYFNSVLGV